MSGYPFFLREHRTLDALDMLSSGESLVLYCGAGVTINRTGLSWNALIQQIFEEAANHGRPNRQKQIKALNFILGTLQDEEQRASILTEYFTEGRPETANGLLTPKLQSALYEDNGWSEGQLLGNIARLALIASVRLPGGVTIITTNYDVYLEEAFMNEAEELVARDGDEIAGLERLVSPEQPSEDDWTAIRMREPVGTDAVVRIVYLHGRVPRAGSPTEGTIVLDEFSYARSHAAVTKTLKQHLQGSYVLTLGASVTDAPLIQSLVMSKESGSVDRRFALIHPRLAIPSDADPGSLTFTDARGVTQTLQQVDVDHMLVYRGRQLGITQLHPISHAQTAQFVEELELSIRLHRSATPPSTRYRDEATGINYEARLESWSAEWEANAPDPTAAYKTLEESLRSRIAVLLGGNPAQNSALRLEIWVRISPSSDNRTLTLYANSTGPLLAEGTRRRARIEDHSTNASVRTFLQGRPLLQTLSDLGLGATEPSRWKTFFSIPLSLLIDQEVEGVPYTASVPCGVITLAGLANADLHERFHALDLDEIETLKDAMTATGLEVLRPTAATP